MGGIFCRDCYYSKPFPVEACVVLNLLLIKWMSLTSDDEEFYQQSSLPQNLSCYRAILFSAPDKVGPVFYEILTYFIATACVCCCGANNDTSHVCSSSSFVSSQQAKAYNIWLECFFTSTGVCAIFYKHATNQLALWFMFHYRESWNCLDNSRARYWCFLLVK